MNRVWNKVAGWYMRAACYTRVCGLRHSDADGTRLTHFCVLSNVHDTKHLCRCGSAW